MSRAEVWKPVPSAIGWAASSFGRVRKIARHKMPNGGIRFDRVEATFGHFDTRRRRYKISVNGRTRWVAPLVCEAFHGLKPLPSRECMHLDEDSTNNKPENLAWGTKSENQNAPKVIARRRAKTEFLNGKTKLSNQQVCEIRRLRDVKAHLLASRYGVTKEYIRRLWKNPHERPSCLEP